MLHLSPEVRMCGLRDVLEVSGGSPSENVVFARRFGGVSSFGSWFFQTAECVVCATF